MRGINSQSHIQTPENDHEEIHPPFENPTFGFLENKQKSLWYKSSGTTVKKGSVSFRPLIAILSNCLWKLKKTEDYKVYN